MTQEFLGPQLTTAIHIARKGSCEKKSRCGLGFASPSWSCSRFAAQVLYRCNLLCKSLRASESSPLATLTIVTSPTGQIVLVPSWIVQFLAASDMREAM